MAEGVPTNNQRGRRSGPCRLWGGLDKARHIVPTALIVRVQCFRKGPYKVVEGPSTRPVQFNRNRCLAIPKLETLNYCNCDIKAILQVWIYKALYDSSYLESKTTMTTGEWSSFISFTWAPLTCSERGGSEKVKMKIYVSSGIRTQTTPVNDRKVSALDRSATLLDIKRSIYSLTVFWNGYLTIPVWNRLWFDTQCKVL